MGALCKETATSRGEEIVAFPVHLLHSPQKLGNICHV